jgi:hypothetical protein
VTGLRVTAFDTPAPISATLLIRAQQGGPLVGLAPVFPGSGLRMECWHFTHADRPRRVAGGTVGVEFVRSVPSGSSAPAGLQLRTGWGPNVSRTAPGTARASSRNASPRESD